MVGKIFVSLCVFCCFAPASAFAGTSDSPSEGQVQFEQDGTGFSLVVGYDLAEKLLRGEGELYVSIDGQPLKDISGAITDVLLGSESARYNVFVEGFYEKFGGATVTVDLSLPGVPSPPQDFQVSCMFPHPCRDTGWQDVKKTDDNGDPLEPITSTTSWTAEWDGYNGGAQGPATAGDAGKKTTAAGEIEQQLKSPTGGSVSLCDGFCRGAKTCTATGIETRGNWHGPATSVSIECDDSPRRGGGNEPQWVVDNCTYKLEFNANGDGSGDAEVKGVCGCR